MLELLKVLILLVVLAVLLDAIDLKEADFFKLSFVSISEEL